MKIMIDAGIVKRGRPYNELIRERILKILAELPLATPQRIKERYTADFNVPISWSTVNNRLTELVKENKVAKTVTTPLANAKGKIRTRIHKTYRLK